jgi:hypothetical protein
MKLPTLPTWREFLEKLASEHNTELYDARKDPHHPGYPTQGRSLTRLWREKRISVRIPDIVPLEIEMLPSTLEEFCVRLQIDPKYFGLVLH